MHAGQLHAAHPGLPLRRRQSVASLRGLQRHRTVLHPARNRECHTGSQLDRVAALEFNAQATVDDVEELVLLLVLVPVVFAAGEDAQAEQNAANLDQGLVVPGVVRSLDRFTDIEELKRAEQRLVVDPVVSLLRHIPTLRGMEYGELIVAKVASAAHSGGSGYLPSAMTPMPSVLSVRRCLMAWYSGD